MVMVPSVSCVSLGQLTPCHGAGQKSRLWKQRWLMPSSRGGGALAPCSSSFPSLAVPQRQSARVLVAAVTDTTVETAGPGVVITGGTRGLGYALAREFVQKGARVVVCGRDEARLQAALSALQQQLHQNQQAAGKDLQSLQVFGKCCDVSNPRDVAEFAAFSADALRGSVQLWLNNAGEVTSKRLLSDIESEEIVRVSNTNVLGSLLCCREAIRIMNKQPPSNVPVYHIFNMGFSRWGAKFTKSACTHKMTKVALTQLTISLNEELEAAGIRSIGVHNLSPGMVLTDLLMKDSTPLSRRFFNVLAEEPDTVAAALVPLICSVEGSGQSIEYLSPLSALVKVLLGCPQIIQGGRFFDKNGDRVKAEGCSYQHNGVKNLSLCPIASQKVVTGSDVAVAQAKTRKISSLIYAYTIKLKPTWFVPKMMVGTKAIA